MYLLPSCPSTSPLSVSLPPLASLLAFSLSFIVSPLFTVVSAVDPTIFPLRLTFKLIPLHDGPIVTFVGPLLGSRPRDPVYFSKRSDRFVMSLKRTVKEDL